MTQTLAASWIDVLAFALLEASEEGREEVVIPVPTYEVKIDLEGRLQALEALGDENASKITVRLDEVH